MKHMFLLSFIIIYCFFGLELGYTETSPFWTHITYSFQHASLMHLVLNSVAFFSFSWMLEKFIPPVIIYFIGITSAVVTSFLCYYPHPVVGSSGIIFTFIGAELYLIASRKMIFRDKHLLFAFLVSVSISLLLSFLNEKSAGMLHLLCLVFGFIFTYITLKIKY